MDGFDTRLLGEPSEDPIMGLLQQQYGGQQAAAPVAQAAAPQYAPVSQAAQVSGDPQSLATLASRFQNELAQLGWTGGDPVIYDYTPGGESGQDFRATPVGVKPEFEQFLQGKNLQVALDPSGGGYRVSLLAGGQPIGQYQESQSGFERFMNQFQPLAVNALLAMEGRGGIKVHVSDANVVVEYNPTENGADDMGGALPTGYTFEEFTICDSGTPATRWWPTWTTNPEA